MFRRMVIAAFLLTGPLIASFTSFIPDQSPAEVYVGPRERNVQKRLLKQIVAFRHYLNDSLLYGARTADVDGTRVRRHFLKARLLFKKFEWGATYFAADLTRRLNGPPVPEIENADLREPSLARTIDPMGLQVIEEFVYPEFDPSHKDTLINQVNHLITNTEYLISYFHDQQLAGWRILDATKLEVFRILALGITGFDNARSLNSMEESAAALESLRDILVRYVHKKSAPLLIHLDAAVAYLHRHPDFDSFDRAAFITRFGNKISAEIAQLEKDLPSPHIHYNRMLRQDAQTLFDADAFNADAFSPGPAFRTTTERVELGKKLFYDTSLSGNGTRSCASCHKPDLAFTDGLATPSDIHDREKRLTRNTPTLLNAALQANYFYDMRALTLEEQVCDVITNKQEMDSSMEAVVRYLSADTTYRTLFATAYSISAPKEISPDQAANALASYIRSLTKLNSRFDAYMRGAENRLSSQELNGFNLFMGKAKWGTCHFVPLFNGMTPPKYVESETEVLGAPVSPTDATPDPDLGYYNIIGMDSYRKAFKIPTVRNTLKTAPYMHNGVFQTLDEVLEFYNHGGAAGLGIALPNQTLPEDSLHLTDREKQDIIAFMGSLESE